MEILMQILNQQTLYPGNRIRTHRFHKQISTSKRKISETVIDGKRKQAKPNTYPKSTPLNLNFTVSMVLHIQSE